MDLNTKIADECMIPIENLVNPRALDFHAEANYIYFADTTSFLIGRQKIDGTERETILKDGKWHCDINFKLLRDKGLWKATSSVFPSAKQIPYSSHSFKSIL